MSETQEKKDVQEVLIEEFFEETDENSLGTDNEMLDLLHFMKDNATPLTNDQIRGMFLMKEFGLEDINHFVLQARRQVTPTKKFFSLIDKLTMASRIKGNAKLSHILKANANPANTMPDMSAYQAKAMKERDLR